MKLDYKKAFIDIFKNSDLKSTFLITTILFCLSSILGTFTGKGLLTISSLIISVLTIGYFLQMMHEEINNKFDSLPDYKGKIRKYLINGLIILLIHILLALLFIIIAILFVIIATIALNAIFTVNPAKITFISFCILFSLTYLLAFTSLIYVVYSQFAENFSIKEGLAIIKAGKFLFKNITDYLKVLGISFLVLLALVITGGIFGGVLGIILIAMLKLAVPEANLLITRIIYVILAPASVYYSIVIYNLYAQIYRLGNEKTETPAEIFIEEN